MFGEKTLKKKRRDFQWPFIGGVALATLALGFIGFAKYFAAFGEARPFSNLFYLTIQLFVLESGSVPGPVPWELNLARFLAPLIAASAAIKGLALIFREQSQMLRVRFLARHAIICGLGRKGMRLVRQLRLRNDRVLVIEKDIENKSLERARELGAIVLIGDAADPEMLRLARCHRAKYLISVCGKDGVNAEVAVNARRLVSENRKRTLNCSVHITDPRLCNLLNAMELEASATDVFRLEFFNIFDAGARVWLNEHPPFGPGEKSLSFRPHLLLIGAGGLGESLLVHAARKWDNSPHRPGEKLGLTIIDRVADVKKEHLCMRYPRLKESCDLEPLQMDIESAWFERADFLFSHNGKVKFTSIFVCLDNDSLGLSAALSLHRRLRGSGVPIVIRMSRREGLANLLHEEHEFGESQDPLFPFVLLDRVCLIDLALGGIKELLAQAIHEDYILQQRKIGQTPERNASMVPWENLSEALKESNRDQANHIGAKLRAVGCGIAVSTDWREPLIAFSQAEIELMARMEHDRWLRERRQAGWKSGRKDIGKRRSPYLVPWDELTEDIKERDRVFIRDLPKFLAGAGFKIYPIGQARQV